MPTASGTGSWCVAFRAFRVASTRNWWRPQIRVRTVRRSRDEARTGCAGLCRSRCEEGQMSANSTSASTNTAGRPARSRLPRGTLSPELIISAAFRVADFSGMDKLTFQSLGRELSAPSTAIYRHFRNKDELLLALIDTLHEEALANTPPPTDDWAHDLMQIAVHTHAAFMRHPRVGSMAAARTARRENEFRSVERKLDCMRRAGLDGAEAARYYRVFA